ncbi:MAG: beta-galactosidase [Candidatus Hydrogenedentes bacterium]|nr:beta-galactosidase [Candidatus Hydrogenedentota bacterium]
MLRRTGLILPALAALMLVNAARAEPLRCPKCRVRAGEKGAPAIVVDGNLYSPIMFAANNQFNRDEILIDELTLAARAGIPFFVFQVRLDDDWAPEHAAETVHNFCSAHPDGYFYVRIWVGANHQWRQEHPDECIVKADGTRLDWVSPASELWLETAAGMLRKRVREIASGPHGDRFIGVCLNNMQTGEWFYRHTNEFMDYSEVNLQAFRAWLKRRYVNDIGLRAAWGQPDITLDTVQFPSIDERDQAVWGPFRHPVNHLPAIDMQRFQSEVVTDAIAYLAKAVKKETRGRALVGAFYAYTMELNNNGPRALAHSGHLALGKLLQCKYIDLIHAPYSYFERALGQPGHLHLPADSLALHGKLGIFEEDTYTHLAQAPGENLIAPGWNDRTTSMDETLAVTRRNFATFFTHRCGIWVFDLLSDGRWNDREFWDSTALLRRIAAESRDTPVFRPEVALLLDEDAVHLMRANTWPVLRHSMSLWRAELDRLGTPVGYYLQSDLPRLPDSIKVLILANAFQLDADARAAIQEHLDRGGTVVWNYAPDLCGPDGPDPARIAAATGIDVEPRFDGLPMAGESALTNESAVIDPQSWQPRFVIVDPDAEVLAHYAGTQEACVALKQLDRGVSVYTAMPRVPLDIMRWLCQQAGVHLYRRTPGMTGVVGPYLFVHTDQEREHEFCWPETCRTVERVVPYRRTPVKRDASKWIQSLPANSTAIYRCQ